MKMSIFTKKKDAIVSKGLQAFANFIINDYGKIIDFAVNSNDKTISLNVLLKGENEDIKITVFNYSIITDDKKTYLQFDNIMTSREWLNILCKNKLSDIYKENKIQWFLVNRFLTIAVFRCMLRSHISTFWI